MINIYNIKKGDVKSCGCLKKENMRIKARERFKNKTPANYLDQTGKKIGVCLVLHRIQKKSCETWYLIRCDCGNEFEARISTIRRALYVKCRCHHKNHKLKKILSNMKYRCYNIKSNDFIWYGKKGILICSEWLRFPGKFIDWALKNGWKEGLTIDRIDSEKDYEPSNCRLITRSENSRKAAEARWASKDSA